MPMLGSEASGFQFEYAVTFTGTVAANTHAPSRATHLGFLAPILVVSRVSYASHIEIAPI